MARGGWLRVLLADPPLIDRITWREGVSPRTLISQDRALIARTVGTLFFVGGVVGWLWLLSGASTDQAGWAIAALSGLAFVVSALLFVVYRRTPMWAFQAVGALGSAMIAASTAAGPAGAEGGYAVFFVWIVLLAFLFFSFPTAIAQTAFAALAYGAVLIGRDSEFGLNFEIGLVAVSGAAGLVVGMLRARVESLATNLASQAHTDQLTAIANRRSFESRFDFELLTADEAGRALSLVICDLDRFKSINDQFGHDEGDAALRLAAETIVNAVRAVDVVFRMGGEEFAVLLPDTEAVEAYAVAERIRASVRDAFAEYPVRLTVSCGLATRLHPGMDRKAMLRAADNALYHAKRNGRDRTIAHDTEVDRQSFSASPVK